MVHHPCCTDLQQGYVRMLQGLVLQLHWCISFTGTAFAPCWHGVGFEGAHGTGQVWSMEAPTMQGTWQLPEQVGMSGEAVLKWFIGLLRAQAWEPRQGEERNVMHRVCASVL